MVIGALRRNLRQWRTRSLSDIWLFLSSDRLLFGSRHDTNRVGMGFYDQLLDVEFRCSPDLPNGRYGAVPIGRETQDFGRVCTWQECIML